MPRWSPRSWSNRRKRSCPASRNKYRGVRSDRHARYPGYGCTSDRSLHGYSAELPDPGNIFSAVPYQSWWAADSYPPGESAKSWGDGYVPCSQKTKDIFLLIHLHLATSLVFRLLFEKMRCCQSECRAYLPVSVLIKKDHRRQMGRRPSCYHPSSEIWNFPLSL